MSDYSYLSNKELINNVELQDNPLAKMLLDRLEVESRRLEGLQEEHETALEQLEYSQDEVMLYEDDEKAIESDLAFLQIKYDDLSAYILEGLDNE